MNAKPLSCRTIEADLVATAMREAEPETARRVEAHVEHCPPCRDDLERYAIIDQAVGTLRESPPALPAPRAREALAARLADLRSRLVAYRIFSSPLGRLLIARSEQGVSLVEYLDEGAGLNASRLRRAGVESREDGAEVEVLYRDLLDYLAGRRTRLEWPLDLRLAHSDFHRRVLHAAAAIPYGAVVSYAGLAREVGQPSAVRAVAQALRTNPLPIVVPCHRIIGADAALVGYAGNKTDLKQHLLGVEGVPIASAARQFRVAREAMYAYRHGDSEYCLPTCGSISRRTLAEYTLFATREGAEAAGFTPCTSCRPDLHPLSR